MKLLIPLVLEAVPDTTMENSNHESTFSSVWLKSGAMNREGAGGAGEGGTTCLSPCLSPL